MKFTWSVITLAFSILITLTICLERSVTKRVLNKFSESSLLEIGTKLTFYYFFLLVLFFGYRVPELFSDEVGINGVGDFLAGAFGPIAFCWLIIGYLMQNKELKNSVEQTTEALKIARDQLIFQQENHNEELRNKHNLNQPKFKIRKINLNCKKTYSAYSLEIENFGAPAYNLSFRKENKFAAFDVQHLATGDIETIGIVLDLKEPCFDKTGFDTLERLTLTFTDAGFEEQKCEVKICAYRVGVHDTPTYYGLITKTQLTRKGVTYRDN